MLLIDHTAFCETPRVWYGPVKDLADNRDLQWNGGDLLTVTDDGFLAKAAFPLTGIVLGVAVAPYRQDAVEADYYQINDSTLWLVDVAGPLDVSSHMKTYNLKRTEDGDIVLDTSADGSEVRVVGFHREIVAIPVGYVTFTDARPSFTGVSPYKAPVRARIRFTGANYTLAWR